MKGYSATRVKRLLKKEDGLVVSIKPIGPSRKKLPKYLRSFLSDADWIVTLIKGSPETFWDALDGFYGGNGMLCHGSGDAYRINPAIINPERIKRDQR